MSPDVFWNHLWYKNWKIWIFVRFGTSPRYHHWLEKPSKSDTNNLRDPSCLTSYWAFQSGFVCWKSIFRVSDRENHPSTSKTSCQWLLTHILSIGRCLESPDGSRILKKLQQIFGDRFCRPPKIRPWYTFKHFFRKIKNSRDSGGVRSSALDMF